MEFKKTEDTPHYYHRMVMGRIEMGVYPVMFGWRVRAGYIGSVFIELDWCCGDRPGFVWGTYCMLKELLERGIKMEDLPGRSHVKPWSHDPEFMSRVYKHNAKLEINAPGEPDFNKIRETFMTKYNLMQL